MKFILIINLSIFLSWSNLFAQFQNSRIHNQHTNQRTYPQNNGQLLVDDSFALLKSNIAYAISTLWISDDFKKAEKELASAGINHTYIHSVAYYVNVITNDPNQIDLLVKKENDYVVESVSTNPKLYSAVCSIPWRYHKAIEELTRCIDKNPKVVKGVKIIPFNYSAGDINTEANLSSNVEDLAFLNKIIKFAISKNLILFINAIFFDTKDFNAIAGSSAFPFEKKSKIIFLNTGAQEWQASFQLLTNLFYDIDGANENRFYFNKIFVDLYSTILALRTMDPFLRNMFIRQVKKWINSKTASVIVLFGSGSYTKTTTTQVINEFKKYFTEQEIDKILKENFKFLTKNED